MTKKFTSSDIRKILIDNAKTLNKTDDKNRLQILEAIWIKMNNLTLIKYNSTLALIY